MQEEQAMEIGHVYDSWDSLRESHETKELVIMKNVLCDMFMNTLNEINEEVNLDFDEENLLQLMIYNFLQSEDLQRDDKRSFIKYMLQLYSSSLTTTGVELLTDILLEENVFGQILADKNTTGMDQVFEHPLFKQAVAQVEEAFKDQKPSDNAPLQDHIEHTKNVLNTFTDIIFYQKNE